MEKGLDWSEISSYWEVRMRWTIVVGKRTRLGGKPEREGRGETEKGSRQTMSKERDGHVLVWAS